MADPAAAAGAASAPPAIGTCFKAAVTVSLIFRVPAVASAAGVRATVIMSPTIGTC